MRHLQLRCMCRSWQSSFKRPLVCLTQPVGCWGVKTCHEINMLHFARCAPLYTFCGRSIVPLDARWIDESCWITGDKIIICIYVWVETGVDCMFPTFSNQFHLFSVQLHSFSAQIHSCSVGVYPFSNCMNWELFSSIFLLFSNSCVEDFLPKCAKRNFEAESVRARADLSFYLCPPNFRPSPSHHPMVWLSVTIQWFWSG